MALDAGKVVAFLSLDTGAFSSGLSSAQVMMETWKSGTATATDKMKALETVMNGTGKALSAAVTLPLAALGTAAVTTFTSFDDAMRQVRATMNASEEDTEKLTAAAKKMGAETRYSASEAASALNYLALAGYDADQAIEALPTVLNLAQAGGLDLAYASDLVTDSMSALNIEMGNLTNFSDQLAVTSQKSNTSISQLGEAILTVGATARSMAGGTVELNAQLGILADSGIKGAEGGTHLRNILLSLSSPADKAAQTMKSIGLTTYDANGNLRATNEIFKDLNGILSTMSEQEKASVLSDLFERTDLAAANTLLEGCGERFDELTGYISACDGASQSMAETMEGGIGGSFRNLKSAVEGLAIEFGENLAPTVQSVADWVTELTRGFSELDEGTQDVILTIAGIAAAAGPAILVMGKLVAAVTTLASPIGIAVAGIAGLIAVIAALRNEMNWEDKLNRKLDIGISAVELEQYKLPTGATDLGTQKAEFTLEVKNKAASAYDQIKEIMNDGVPESPEDYATMASGVNAVIAASMDAIETNYNTRSANLKLLLDNGLLSETEYKEQMDALETETQNAEAALQANATAVTDYITQLIAANAPMTEEQLAYLQQLIDKLAEASVAAGLATDAVQAGYKLAYERVSGGYGTEGDETLAASYVEQEYNKKADMLQEAREAAQAAWAEKLSTVPESTPAYEQVLEDSQKDAEKWNEAAQQLKQEREAMYASLIEGTAQQEEIDLSKVDEFIQKTKELEELKKAGGEGNWYDYYYSTWAGNINKWVFGEENPIEQSQTELSAMADELNAMDVSKLQAIMGYLYANGADGEYDASALETAIGLLTEASELVKGVDLGGQTDEVNAQAPVLKDAVGNAAKDAAKEADVSDEIKTAAVNSVSGFIDAVTDLLPNVRRAGARMGVAFAGGFENKMEIKSPSRLMRRNALYTVQGYTMGIEDNKTLVDSAVGHMTEGLTKAPSGGSFGGSSRRIEINLNLNGAVMRSDEDVRTLARKLGGYVNAMNYGVD